MRPHALAAVAFDEEFQQSHPFAPCRIGESHTTVLDPHAADVPQCNPPVSLFAGYAAVVEFVGERPPGSGRQSFRRRRRHVGQRIAPSLVETQHDTLLRPLPQRPSESDPRPPSYCVSWDFRIAAGIADGSTGFRPDAAPDRAAEDPLKLRDRKKRVRDKGKNAL